MSTYVTAFQQTSGDGFSAGTVNNIFATNIVKLTLTKTVVFWIGSRKIGKLNRPLVQRIILIF